MLRECYIEAVIDPFNGDIGYVAKDMDTGEMIPSMNRLWLKGRKVKVSEAVFTTYEGAEKNALRRNYVVTH